MTDIVILREATKIVNLEIMNKIIDKINHPEKTLDRVTLHQYDTMVEYYLKYFTEGSKSCQN